MQRYIESEALTVGPDRVVGDVYKLRAMIAQIGHHKSRGSKIPKLFAGKFRLIWEIIQCNEKGGDLEMYVPGLQQVHVSVVVKLTK